MIFTQGDVFFAFMSPQELTSLATTALHEPADRIRELVECFGKALTTKQRRAAAIDALDQAAANINKQRWGRVRTWMLVAFALSPGNAATWQHAIRLQVLSVGSIDAPSRHRLWGQLSTESMTTLDRFHPGLVTRLATLASLDRLRDHIRRRFQAYIVALKNRPVGLLKSALAYADFSFHPQHLGDRDDSLIVEGSNLNILIDAKEELAECVSTLIAEAVKQAPMSHVEPSMPASRHIESGALEEILANAALRLKYRYLCKHVDALDYEIREELHVGTTAYVLVAPSLEHELWLRHGYVETQLEALAAPLQVDAGVPLVSLRDLYAHVIDHMRASGQPLLTLHATPYRRYKPQLPWELVSRSFLGHSFYEDFHDLHMNGLELQLDRDAVDALELAQGLTGVEFMSLYRVLRYFALLHADFIGTIDENDAEALYNSLLPLVPRAELVALLGCTGAPPAKIEAFIDLVSLSLEQATHVDLQYTPLIKHGSNLLVLPRLAATSAALRNTLANLRRRVRDAGDQFAKVAADQLANVFGTAVTTSKKLEDFNLGSTDVDVAAFLEETLYIWECKHSLPPTSPHESRDVWRDIERAVDQILLAEKILSNDPNLGQRLHSWFPDVPRGKLHVSRIISVVLMSTRMWSGMHLRGVPVRDIHSLRRVFSSDRFGIPVNRDRSEHEFERFGAPGPVPIELSELDDYLSPKSRYWSLRRAWHAPVTVVHARIDDAVIAHETTIAGPYDYDGLVPDAIAHGYGSLGRYIRTPNIQRLDDFVDSDAREPH